MGLVLQVQLIWLLLNLCIIAFALDVAGSSGLYLESPSISSSSESPRPQPTNKGYLPLLPLEQSTTPIQSHGLSTSTPTQPPHDSPFPVIKLPQDSVPPLVAETPLKQPHYSVPPPVEKDAAPPPVIEPPYASSSPPEPKSPKAAAPLPTTAPPEIPPFEFPVEAPPPSSHEGPKNTSYMQSSPISLHYLSPPPQVGPSIAPLPPAVLPTIGSGSSPLMLPLPAEPPPISSSPPPPDEAPLHEPPPSGADIPTLKLSPPFVAPTSHDSPAPPGAVSPYPSSVPLSAKPPGASVQISVTQPPEALTLTPPSITPSDYPSLPPGSTMQPTPITQNVSAPPPQMIPSNASSSELSPPPQSTLLNASSPSPPLVPHPSSVDPSLPPSTSFPSPPMVPPHLEAPPVLPSSSPAVPPNVPSFPPPMGLPYRSPPPRQIDSPPPFPAVPPNSSFPPPLMGAPHASPANPAGPPIISFPPPLMVPPPLETTPVLPLPSPPVLPNISSFPPPLGSPYGLSPPRQMNSPPPFPAVPPTSSFPPPLTSPPILETPPVSPLPPPALPPNASFFPPLLGPPYGSSPPRQVDSPPPPPFPVVPPNASFSPPLMVLPHPKIPPVLPSPSPAVPPNVSSLSPPFASSPPIQVDYPPASPPTPTPPSISLVPPPSMVPPFGESPPVLPSPSSAVPPIELTSPPPLQPPFASPPPLMVPPFMESPPVLPSQSPGVPPQPHTMPSPPMPLHSSSPMPQIAPPHILPPPSAEQPWRFFATPPIKLPHTPAPHSSNLPGAAPSRKPSPPSNSPPRMVPSHILSAPPPSKLSYHAAPPDPTMQITAIPPHSSQRKATKEGAPPPEASPSSGTPSRTWPPVSPRKQGSPPPISQPEHNAPSPRLHASEPPPPTRPAPAPRNKPVHGTAQPLAPPSGAPSPLSPAHNSSHHASPVAMIPSASPSPEGSPEISTSPSLSSAPPGVSKIPFLSPTISPSGSSPRFTMKPRAPPIQSLPPPPPNADCAYQTCQEPLTNRPPGSPCGCVLPMQVGLRLSVALYTFFPLVAELAKEIAAGEFLQPSQVRVMGANAATQESEETIVKVDLVPLEENFDSVTAHLISDRFLRKQVVIDKSVFGDYDVLYVRYPGLPPSPPLSPADSAVVNGMPDSVGDPNGSKIHPLGVNVTKQKHKHRLNAILAAVIALAAVLGVLICCLVAWILVRRQANDDFQPTPTSRAVTSLARPSGPMALSTESGQSSSLSLGSSLAPYTGSAKSFSASELEKATDNFNPSNILGEGGFGLVYSGILDEETKVAVKVLKRDDQQGGREFLAEVEMLSRLHHRNLVKLIGICIDERLRCLVYELIPNGSVESHLHGVDGEVSPLDWASRMKIALGAARGLAYLHEDSSPRVIHRDFKSSNILLENDFTPKVSDFGLARNALDEENRHISTRVMGTFGYVAPEYAMTGHLLVKSDVYSYGVVLLELLTGMKPVDMSQPAGQENLVTWTRPLLTSKEGLESIIDPSLGSNVPFESVTKVAAIASMCVQPEVSHRPFMGEVVQALKLVCDECDNSRDADSRSQSCENLSLAFDAKANPDSVTVAQDHMQGQFSLHTFTPEIDVEKGLSVTEMFNAPATLGRQSSDSFRRHSASGPLRTEKGRQFWQRMRISHGSGSEHGVMYRLWAGSH